MHCEASSASGASIASPTSGLTPLHSSNSRWLCAETSRLAMAHAVSRLTESCTSSFERSSETSDDMVIMSTGSTGESCGQ